MYGPRGDVVNEALKDITLEQLYQTVYGKYPGIKTLDDVTETEPASGVNPHPAASWRAKFEFMFEQWEQERCQLEELQIITLLQRSPTMKDYWFITMNVRNRSIMKGIWGCNSKSVHGEYFLSYIKPGAILAFVFEKKVLAFATFVGIKKREIGPLIGLTQTNEELGWTGDVARSDTEIHFNNVYDVSNCDLLAELSPISSFIKSDGLTRDRFNTIYYYTTLFSKAKHIGQNDKKASAFSYTNWVARVAPRCRRGCFGQLL